MSSNQGIAVVTGASAGIGKIYAVRLARRGYDLVLVARRGDRLEAVSRALEAQHGIKARAFAADLAWREDLDRVVELVQSEDRITMLVNNAGIAKIAPSEAIARADQQALIDLNITASSRLSLAALAAFRAKNRGTLVNISSVLGFHALPVTSIYSGTKAYLMTFTRGLQEEVAGTNIVVQLVLPSVTATDIWENAGMPLSQLDPSTVMSAEDCVDAALAGLDRGEKITLPSVEDQGLWDAFEAARVKLFGASQTGRAASRYGVGG